MISAPLAKVVWDAFERRSFAYILNAFMTAKKYIHHQCRTGDIVPPGPY